MRRGHFCVVGDKDMGGGDQVLFLKEVLACPRFGGSRNTCLARVLQSAMQHVEPAAWLESQPGSQRCCETSPLSGGRGKVCLAILRGSRHGWPQVAAGMLSLDAAFSTDGLVSVSPHVQPCSCQTWQSVRWRPGRWQMVG